MKISKLHSLLLLLVVVLVIYYPAISGITNTIDDTYIIEAFGINGQRTLRQILLPNNQFYFRPLIELTYYFDSMFWGLNPSTMHLENILFHAANVMLVYQIASTVSVLAGGISALPLVSASLFAIHPVNTEAVSWIAGRTDLLAAFFVLLATLYLFRFIQSGNIKNYYYSIMAMLVSFLAKETAVMLLPALLLILVSVKVDDKAIVVGALRTRGKIVAQYCLLLLALASYVATRLFLKPVGTDNAFSIAVQNSYNLLTPLKSFLQVSGFYVKKLFIPFPLNFAIYEISEWYLLAGLAVVVVSVYLLLQRNILTSCLLMAFIFIFPAIIVKLTGVSWTPVAERYLYIPSAFFSIGISGALIQAVNSAKYKKLFYSVLAILAVIIASLTYKRTLVWQDNLLLYQDAVNKSPNFGDIHNELGIALAKAGNCDEARKHFLRAEQLSSRSVIRELAQSNILMCDLQGKTDVELKEIIENYVATHTKIPPDILKMHRKIITNALQSEHDTHKQKLLTDEIITINDRIYSMTKDPVCLYNNGQLLLKSGDNMSAVHYFRKTISVASPDAYYFDAAKKQIIQLDN